MTAHTAHQLARKSRTALLGLAAQKCPPESALKLGRLTSEQLVAIIMSAEEQE